ncbi:enhancer of split mgamma protein-like [Oratosquilla oratoria]|uniref:enhancer of split mgamma protein-like n=1 Tax=Oratosquilla oratoria TaxID=337810 RepID=UPI003F76F6BC
MATYEVNIEDAEPMSRTYQYRKVMKPMLERRRRARINRCLDELKDLMVGALQSEGETITKLEKADVLELTVRHLRKLKQQHALAIPSHNAYHEKFCAGFTHCANEVSRFVSAVPGVDLHVSQRLLSHLGQYFSQIDKLPMAPAPPAAAAVAPVTPPPHSTPAPMQPITVAVPRVYTPPASPDHAHELLKPSPTTPVYVVSPKPTSVSPGPAAPVMKVAMPATSPVWRPW